MSDFDLAEAVEAAARTRYERVRRDRIDGPPPWHEVSPIHQDAWRKGVLAEVIAAAPLIEAQVRERVAQEIVGGKDDVDWDYGLNADAYLNGMTNAARIARGGAS